MREVTIFFFQLINLRQRFVNGWDSSPLYLVSLLEYSSKYFKALVCNRPHLRFYYILVCSINGSSGFSLPFLDLFYKHTVQSVLFE